MSLSEKQGSKHRQIEVKDENPSGSLSQEEQTKAKLTSAPEVMSAR